MNECPHFSLCSGCREPLSFNPPPVWKEVLTFFDGKAAPLLHQGSPLHWRHRAKVAVRGTADMPLIGLFREGTHQVVSIPFCLVHHPHLNQAFDKVLMWMRSHELFPYQEESHQGDLRYLQGVVHRETGRVQLTCVLNADTPNGVKGEMWQKLLKQLGEQEPDFWHSLWVNTNDRRTNTIFGPHWKLIFGDEWLWESFSGVKVCYGPASFGQANLPLFERMLFRLRDLVPIQACVVEFYAGVGVIGLFLAEHCQSVVCCESNPNAKECFEKSQSVLSSKIAEKLSFLSSPTEKAFHLLEGATTVIVDPPRKGLDASFFPALAKASTVQQLLYISCGWEAFQRDCEHLWKDGWQVENAEGYLFFPGSNHIEMLVNFKK